MPSEERDRQICSRYLEGIPASRIAMDTGLSPVRIQQILKAGGAIGKPRKERSEEVDKTISDDHLLIGRKISLYRMLNVGADRKFFSEKLQWSHVKLAYVESGVFNLTLTDLQDIARIMQISLSELLNKENK